MAKLHVFREGTCVSYLLIVERGGGRESLVVDPHPALAHEYRELLAGAWPTHAIGLASYRHHPSSSAAGARAQGDFRVGEIEIQKISTPGVSRDSVCLYAPALGIAFTGDLARPGGVGEPGFPDADSGQLWDSLKAFFEKIPGETRLLPAHELGGGILFSLARVERERGPFLAGRDRDAFIAARRQAESSLAMAEAGDPGRARQGEGSISADKYAAKLGASNEGTLFLDVREPEEFAAGHIPGTVNLPLGELSLHWPRLAAAKRIYLSCQSGRRSASAAKTLSYLGLSDVLNVVGGIQSWSQAGLPVRK